MNTDNPSLFIKDGFDPVVLPDMPLSDKVVDWLTVLFEETDWRCVTLNRLQEYEYDGFPIGNYLKALALPYLVHVSASERALARLIRSRSKLQKLCGFRLGATDKKTELEEREGQSVLGERTFWHLRDKYKKVYAELIIKTLISLVLSGTYPKLNLPFVEAIEEKEFNADGNLIAWTIDAYRSTIVISLPWMENNLSSEENQEAVLEWYTPWRVRFINCKNFDEYRRLKNEYDKDLINFSRRNKKGFSQEITFPIDVSTTLTSGERIFFRLKVPDWSNRNASSHQFSFFPEDDSQQKKPKIKYDKACNILVVRTVNGEKEILLSRRRDQGIGEGSYAAPGGKQKDNETLEKCAKRELEEETGLLLIDSKPVSIYLTRKDYMGGKQIMSVGVLAETWNGTVETREPHKHSGWEWHKIRKLPSPLFEYTEIAINQYLEETYANLTWSDFEEKPETQLFMFADKS
jgi:8-oxo-dGTP diphosphatase